MNYSKTNSSKLLTLIGENMQTIKLEIEDSKVDIVLNIIQNLKDNIITKYEIVSEIKEHQDFINISEKSLEKIWDNQEDSIYDKFLKVWCISKLGRLEEEDSKKLEKMIEVMC